MTLSKEEMALLGLEIVSYSGEARTYLLDALKKSEEKKFDEVENLLEKANNLILKAHKVQTELLTNEAKGEHSELNLIMVHGQDHLMTVILLRDLLKYIVNIHKKLA